MKHKICPEPIFELVYHATKPPKRIVWAYDELQNLGQYLMVPPSELFGRNHEGRPNVAELRLNRPGEPQEDIILPVCYRNTPWALTAAHAIGFGVYRDGGLVQFFDDPQLWIDIGYDITNGRFSPGEKVVLRRSSASRPEYFDKLLNESDAVSYHVFPDRQAQAIWIADMIRRNIMEDELEPRDILVVFPDARTVPSEAGAVIAALQRYDIPAHVAGVGSSRDELFIDGSVAIASIYRAKGNEAPMVYVANADYCESTIEQIRRRNVLFTAITRSRAWIRIGGCGSNMALLAKELDQVREKGYCLVFTVPTPEARDKMRQIHRDMTEDDIVRIAKVEQDLGNLLQLMDQGVLLPENLSPDIRDRLEKWLRRETSEN